MWEEIVTDNGDFLILEDARNLVTDWMIGDPTEHGEMVGQVEIFPAIESDEKQTFRRVN